MLGCRAQHIGAALENCLQAVKRGEIGLLRMRPSLAADPIALHKATQLPRFNQANGQPARNGAIASTMSV